MGSAAVLTRMVPLLVTLTAAVFVAAAAAAAAAATADPVLANENEDVHILQSHAHTFIGAVLPVRTRGIGLYGCGPPNKTSETILQALKIVLDAINTGFAKPKIGVRLMDSCGRKRVAVDLLARMFPELQTGLQDPPLPRNRWLAGLVDGAGLADDAGDAGAALLAARVAVAPLREWLTATSRVKALMAVVRYLRWERVVVVRSEDEVADDVLWREWAAAQSKDGPCVVAVERNVSAALSHGLPVIVLVPQEEVSALLISVTNHTSPATIFLANRPDGDFKYLNIPPELTLLTLAPGRLPPSLDPDPHNLAAISLAEAIVSAGQSLGLLALAVLRADNLYGMSRLEFLNSNFAPLAAAAVRGDVPDDETNSWKALILSPSSVHIVRLDDTTENVFRVDLLSGVIHTLSPNPPPRAPQEPLSSNATCWSAARTSGARRIEEQHSSNSLTHEEFHTLLESPQGVYVVFFAPMHSSAKLRSLAYCPPFDHETADVVSARRLEAFLWALRRLNQQLAREDGSVQLGALLGDSCSSNIHAMTLAARTPGNGGQGLAVVVNALPSSDAKVAADILADREITSIATNHLLDTAPNSPHPYTLQVETSLQNIVTSILKMLSHLGWSYVSIVHSSESGSDHERGFQLFQSTAARHGVCVAATLDVSRGEDLDDDAVAKLVGARAEGARGVVVWADEEGSRRLFRAVARAVAQVTLRREDLFWFLASPLGETSGVLDEFGNVVGGALVFGPHHRGVPEFHHHLTHLSVSNGTTSAVEREWTKFYREQCGKGPCSADHPSAIAGDWAVIQSVYAAGIPLAKLARTGCANSRSSCVFDGDSLLIGEAVNRAVRQSISTRADGPAGTDYHFSSSGSGAIGVEVQNFRRRTGSRSRSLGDVFFQRVGVFSDDRFSSLEGMVAYRDAGDEVMLSSLTSQCVGAENKCLRCRSAHSRFNRTLGDWIVNWPDNKPPDSKSKKVTVMVAATLAVHESSANPAQCGQTVSTAGVEQLEAFLWAVDQVNRNWTDPGVKLGAITLDTCGSTLRTSRHVAELLSSESSPGSLVVALVAGGETRLAVPVADAAAAAGLPAMAPASRGPPPDRKAHPPYPLQLAPSANRTASALVALIMALKRSCVGVLYLKDALDYEEAAIELEKQLSVATSSAASMIKSSLTASSAATRGSSATREAILRLRRPSSNTPSQVVVVLAPPDHIDKVFSVVAGLNDEGLWTSSNVIWVTLGAEQILMAHSSHISTAFSLKPRTARVPELERHFENLTPDKNFRDPWFEEYWSSVFHCRGSGCKTKPPNTLTTEHLRQNPDVPNIINSVLAVGHALQTVRREMCPDQHIVGRTFCRPMAEVSRVRSRLLEILPRMAFVGAGPRAVAFSSMGESSNSGIEVLMMESSNFSPKLVADIDSTGSVTWIEAEALKSYENSNEDDSCEVPYNVTVSSPKPTDTTKTPEVPAKINGYAFQVDGTGKNSMALLAVLPVHGRGEASFRCGELNENAVCAAATVLYATSVAKRNNSNGDSVGVSVVDSCSQPERAFSSLFSVLAASPLPKFAAALVLDGMDDGAVRPLLTAQGIPHVPHSASLHDAKTGRPEPEARAREASLAAALVDVAAALHGPSTIVVHGLSPRARSLARAVESASLPRCAGGIDGGADDAATGVCLSAVLPAPPGLHVRGETRPGALYLLASQVPGAVVIVAPSSADDVRALLVAAQSALVPRLSFVVPVASKRHAASLRVVGHTVLSVVPDASVAELSSDNSEAENATSAEITDNENSFRRWLEKPEGLQSSGLPTAWLARLDSAHCAQDQGPWKIPDLIQLVSTLEHDQSKSSTNMTTDKLVEAMSRQETAAENLEEITTFKIWRNVQSVGSWTPERRLTLTTHPEVLLLEETMISDRPSALHNLQFIWALALGAVALLGMLLTLATAVFFLSAAAVARTPISGSAGTSVLGYLILLALLILHGGVFSLVLAPSEVSCGARRLFPALAYALIFSAMFLKVLTTWQMCERKDVALGPLPLILRALALAAPQLLVSVGWIVLMPPVVHSVPAATGNSGTVWLCYPATAGDADMHQLLSMSYTCLLMVATAVVALLCSSKIPSTSVLRIYRSNGTLRNACKAFSVFGRTWRTSVWGSSSGCYVNFILLVLRVIVDVHWLLQGFTFRLVIVMTSCGVVTDEMLSAAGNFAQEELLEEGTMLHQESRSILAAALAVAVQLGCWGLAVVSLMPGSSHPFREPVAAGVHTTAAATLLACLFLPKLRLYLKLKRNARDAANIAASATARPQTVYGVSHFQQPFGGKINPVDMFVGDSASTAASHTASDSSSTSAGHYSDPTQAIPSSLYSLDMFTGQTALPDVPVDLPVGTLRSVRSDAHHGQCGTLRAASMTGTLRGNIVGSPLGGTLRGNIGGTLRASRGGMHCMPGTNEFTPPHRTSSTLLLPSQEGVSYM